MEQKSQTKRKTTHARIYEDKKKRVKKIALTRELKGQDNFSEVSVLDEILTKELPKIERKLGIN